MSKDPEQPGAASRSTRRQPRAEDEAAQDEAASTNPAPDDAWRYELIRTGKVALPTEVEEARARLAQEGTDPSGLDDASVLAADKAQEVARTKAAIEEVLRRQTGKDPATLTDAERERAFRNELLDQSGATDKLQAGRRIIGAEHPHDKTDAEIADDLGQIAEREFIAETLGKRSGDLTPQDLADFERLRDRAAVEAETGQEFDALSPLERAQARQAIRDRAFDTSVGATDTGTDPGSIPGFGDHGGRVSDALAGPGTGLTGGGAGTGASGGGGGTGGTGTGGTGSGVGGGTATSGGGRGPDPLDGFAVGGVGAGAGASSGGDASGGGAAGGGASGGGAAGTGGTSSDAVPVPGAGDEGASDGGSDGSGGAGSTGGSDGTDGSSGDGGGGGAPDTGSPDLRPVDVYKSDGTTERGYITPDGDVVDQDGNVIPADSYDGYSTVTPSGESDDGTGDGGDDSGDGDGSTGGDDSGGGDDSTGGDAPPDDDETESTSGIEYTPAPDGEGGGARGGVTREELAARLTKGPPGTETQPVDDMAGGFVAPGPGTPVRVIPGVDQPGPDGSDVLVGRGGRPGPDVPSPDSGVIDPPDDPGAFGAGAIASGPPALATPESEAAGFEVAESEAAGFEVAELEVAEFDGDGPAAVGPTASGSAGDLGPDGGDAADLGPQAGDDLDLDG